MMLCVSVTLWPDHCASTLILLIRQPAWLALCKVWIVYANIGQTRLGDVSTRNFWSALAAHSSKH
jgi:hypothetical protein